MKGKQIMEILTFALVAGFKIYTPEKRFIPEPYPFQPLDVQALKQVYNARFDSSNRSLVRPKPYAVQAAS
jgi:hypothetical protein